MRSEIDYRLDEQTIVRRASVGDLETVLVVVHDATRRVQELGFPQWRLYLTGPGIRAFKIVWRARWRSAPGRAAGRGTFSVEWHDESTGPSARRRADTRMRRHRDARPIGWAMDHDVDRPRRPRAVLPAGLLGGKSLGPYYAAGLCRPGRPGRRNGAILFQRVNE
jgi:hypothetical protein